MGENGFLDPEEQIKYVRRFRKISLGIFYATVAIELGMSIAMYFAGLIYEEIWEYVQLYVIRPIGISALFLVVGLVIARFLKNPDNKMRAYIISMTFMFSNIVNVHNVYFCMFFIFCIPIYLTVVLSDKKLLYVVTGISELCVIGTCVYCMIVQKGAYKYEYYTMSTGFTVVLLLACCIIARQSINLLIHKRKLLLQAIAEADAANRSKSEFLSNMSHEIRTPINAMLGLDEMIIRESTEEDIRNYAVDIHNSGKVLLGLVNDVLDFSKIEAGKMSLIPAEYDISLLIEDLVNSVTKSAYDKGLEFSFSVNKNIPRGLYGDEIRIRQIILNILSNAIKYTEQGTVTLDVDYRETSEDKIYLMVSVKDTGRGMSKDDVARLFKAFERFDETQNRKIEGTGLGMTITKKLLALMDSELSVESELGKGSTFSFEVLQDIRDRQPVGDHYKNSMEAKKKKAVYKEKFVAPKARIMVVDDMKLNLKVVAGLLKRTEVQVETVLSGEECLKLAKEKNYDLFLIDHMMPEMDGIELVEHLKEETYEINHNAPKIILTANAIAGAKEEYLAHGFVEYLTKPVESSKLEEALMTYLPDDKVQVRN